MSPAVPTLYNRPPVYTRLSLFQRFFAFSVAACTLAVLITAMKLHPNPAGTGTHHQLGLPPCNFKTIFHLPCPTCGMTTSFAYFVRGNFIASFYVQPMGMILAAFSFIAFWFCSFEFITGRNLRALFGFLPLNKILYFFMILFIVAWAWKIMLQLTNHDGWIG